MIFDEQRRNYKMSKRPHDGEANNPPRKVRKVDDDFISYIPEEIVKCIAILLCKQHELSAVIAFRDTAKKYYSVVGSVILCSFNKEYIAAERTRSLMLNYTDALFEWYKSPKTIRPPAYSILSVVDRMSVNGQYSSLDRGPNMALLKLEREYLLPKNIESIAALYQRLPIELLDEIAHGGFQKAINTGSIKTRGTFYDYLVKAIRIYGVFLIFRIGRFDIYSVLASRNRTIGLAVVFLVNSIWDDILAGFCKIDRLESNKIYFIHKITGRAHNPPQQGRITIDSNKIVDLMLYRLLRTNEYEIIDIMKTINGISIKNRILFRMTSSSIGEQCFLPIALTVTKEDGYTFLDYCADILLASMSFEYHADHYISLIQALITHDLYSEWPFFVVVGSWFVIRKIMLKYPKYESRLFFIYLKMRTTDYIAKHTMNAASCFIRDIIDSGNYSLIANTIRDIPESEDLIIKCLRMQYSPKEYQSVSRSRAEVKWRGNLSPPVSPLGDSIADLLEWLSRYLIPFAGLCTDNVKVAFTKHLENWMNCVDNGSTYIRQLLQSKQ
jgi:hypothetical protein